MRFGLRSNEENFSSQREAREQQNSGADPFTRSRCAPTLVSKVNRRSFLLLLRSTNERFSQAPQTKEELIRELQMRRAADEAAAKKKVEQQEQQEKLQKQKEKETRFDVEVVSSLFVRCCFVTLSLVDGEKFLLRSDP